MRPDPDPGEQVDLRELPQFFGLDLDDRTLVHDAGRDVPCGDEIAKPLGRERVDLVVEGGH